MPKDKFDRKQYYKEYSRKYQQSNKHLYISVENYEWLDSLKDKDLKESFNDVVTRLRKNS